MGLPGQNILSSSYYIHYDTHYIYFCGNFQACCTRLFIRNVVLTSMKILQNYWTPGGKLYHYFPLKFWLHVSYTHTHTHTVTHCHTPVHPRSQRSSSSLLCHVSDLCPRSLRRWFPPKSSPLPLPASCLPSSHPCTDRTETSPHHDPPSYR